MEPLQLTVLVLDDLVWGCEPEQFVQLRLEGVVPVVEAMEASPILKLAFAPSPAFLRHLQSEAPELLQRLRALSAKGRLEGVIRATAAFPLLGEREMVAQLRQQQIALQASLGTPARVCYSEGLAWDGNMPVVLQRAGLGAVIVDGGLLGGDGPWVADRNGFSVTLLANDRRLTRMVPFAPWRDLGHALRRAAAMRSLVMSLPLADLASVGPKWFQHFGQLAGRIGREVRLAVPWSVVERVAPLGRVAPANGTPPELGAWAQTEEAGDALLRAEESLLSARDPILAELFPAVPGPPFEAFLSRNDAAFRLVAATNRLLVRAQTQRKSGNSPEAVLQAAIRACPAAVLRPGPGGHLDDARVRAAAWDSLLGAEAALPVVGGAEVQAPARPQDPGSQVELRLPFGMMCFRPAEGAGIDQFAIYGLGNLCNTLERQSRPGYALLQRDSALPSLLEEVTEELPALDETGLGAESALDVDVPRASAPPLPARRSRLPLDCWRLGFVDNHLRHLFTERLVSVETDVRALWRGQARDKANLHKAAWRLERCERVEGEVELVFARECSVEVAGRAPGMLQVVKKYRVSATTPRVDVAWELQNRSREPLDFSLVIELNLCLDGARGAERTVHLPGARPFLTNEPQECGVANDIALRLGDLASLVRIRTSREVRVWSYPLDTPAQRWGEVVSAPQGLCLSLVIPAPLFGEEKTRLEATMEVVRR